jgi:signal peptidase I
MRRFRVAGDSMLPALTPGDILLCRRPGLRVERGDFVVFPYPRRPDFQLVKRVVGLGGETVRIDWGEVLIDGRPLDRWGRGSTYPDGVWTIPEEEVFVLSDNRLATRDDSRHFGPVPVADLARVWWRVRIGRGRSANSGQG